MRCAARRVEKTTVRGARRWAAGAVLVLAAARAPCAETAGRSAWVEALLDAREKASVRREGAAPRRPLPDFGRSDFTISAWIRTSGGGTILSKTNPRGAWVRGGKAFFVRDGRLVFDIGWVGEVTARRRVNDDDWHHVAVASRRGALRIYVDGRPDGQGSLSGGPDKEGWVIQIGRTADNFGGDFHGRLDEVRIHARALADAEVAALAAAGAAPGAAQGLAAHWPFDGDGRDASGGGNDAVPEGCGFAEGRSGRALDLSDGRAVVPSGSADPRAGLWADVETRFPDPRSQMEMAWEREDGVWDGTWKAGGRADLAARYAEAADRIGAAGPPRPAGRDASAGDLWTERERYHRERRRRLTGSPSMDGGRIVFVKRFTYDANHYYTEYINATWRPGGNLCVLDLATGAVRDLLPAMTNGVFERFDLSFDARKVVFAWKGGAQEGYRIYEVGVDGSGLRQLTFPPPDEAELQRTYRVTGHYHHGTDDMMPCYLPDGGIAFISTRCQYGILCDPPDDFTTTVLHRMEGDGGNLRPISRSSVSEACPVVLPDGRLLYTRWEYVDKGAVSVKCLWAVRPDGSASSEVYGNDIALPPTLIYGRPIPGAGHRYVALGAPHYPQNGMGTVIRLDMTRGIRTREPMTYVTTDVDVQSEGGFAFRQPDGSWRQDGRGRGRLFKDPYPLSDDLFLVAHKPAGPAWNDARAYGLYLLDATGGVRLVYRDPEISCFEPYPLRPRPPPPPLGTPADPARAARGQAVAMVADVYAGLEGVPRGTVRSLRVLEQVPRPWAAQWKGGADSYDQQHICVTKDTHLGLKVQHGIVPVEADGSAHFVVPAGRNVFLQALDEHGMAVQTERTYVYYAPGETRSCVGCHETPEKLHGAGRAASVPLAFRRAPSVPGPQPGEGAGGRPLHYPSDVQPVWDRHCVACHGGANPKGGLDLRGEPTEFFSVSYENLVPERRRGPRRDRGLLGVVIGENHPKTGNVAYLPAGSLGARTSVLVAMLGRGKVRLADAAQEARARRLAETHAGVAAAVTAEELLRVSNWIDTNCQYYGSYWGRRNLRYRDRPDFRRVPTFDEAVSLAPPPWTVSAAAP